MIQIDYIYSVNNEINVVFYSTTDLAINTVIKLSNKNFTIKRIDLTDTWAKYTASYVTDVVNIKASSLMAFKRKIDNTELELA